MKITQDLIYNEENLSSLSLAPEDIFENCEFVGINFSELSSDFTFKSVSFTDCVFKSCNLANQNLTNTIFRNVKFEACNLIGINYCNMKRVEGLSYADCKLNFSSWQSLKLKKMPVLNCQVIDADFSGSDLSESAFTNSILSGTNFNGATLVQADFRGAKDYLFDVRTAKLKGLKLSMPEAMNLLQVLDINVQF